jgi:transcriptional regulator with XRE-family HTH domain
MPRVRAQHDWQKRRLFGDWVRERRLEFGLALRKLEAATGISRSVLSRLERGQGVQVFGRQDWEALGRALHLDPGDLLMWHGWGIHPEDVEAWKEFSDEQHMAASMDFIAHLATPERKYPSVDPRWKKAIRLLWGIWQAAKSDKEAWRTVEEFLEFQHGKIKTARKSGKPRSH